MISLLGKLEFLTESFMDQHKWYCDKEEVEKVESYTKDLIEELQKEYTVYELNYGQDADRSNQW